jgi:hypothetical protein
MGSTNRAEGVDRFNGLASVADGVAAQRAVRPRPIRSVLATVSGSASSAGLAAHLAARELEQELRQEREQDRGYER